jgi:RNA polymerase sigma-70 factor (ECF subfamily)
MYLEYFKKEILPLKQKLYRFARAYLKDEATAEDVVQDVFLKLWDKREDFRRINNIEAWSMTITRNMVISKLRKSQFNTASPQDMNMHENHDYNNETPERILERNETRTGIKGIIASLPEKQKEVIVLREIEGYSYAEISEIMGLDQNLVKVTLFRARENLRKKILKTERYGI